MPTNNRVTSSYNVCNTKAKYKTGKNEISESQFVVSFSPNDANFDVEAAVGLKVEFELELSKNIKGLKVPNEGVVA